MFIFHTYLSTISYAIAPMFLHEHVTIEDELLLQILDIFRVISCSFVYAKSVTHKLDLERSKRSVENLTGKG